MNSGEETGKRRRHSGGCGGCTGLITGILSGAVLTYAYVRWNVELPEWMQLPGKVESLGTLAAADAALDDPSNDLEAKQRAVAQLLSKDSTIFMEVDGALGYGITHAVIDRKARRRLEVFRSQIGGVRETFRKDLSALRERQMEKYGVETLDDLVSAMGQERLKADAFLYQWLQERFPGSEDAELFDLAMSLSLNEVFPPAPQRP